MTILDTKKLVVDEKAHGYAKIYAALLKEEFQRKRAYASIVALYALIDLFEKTPNQVQKSMTLFRNPLINEEYEITDLYVNNWHLDIRVVTNSSSVLVPKIHYDSDIVPDFYAVVKVDTKLETAELVGFVDTASAQKQGFDYHYYSIPFDNLITYEAFLDKVKEQKNPQLKEEDHELFRESYLACMDNEIDTETRNRVLKHLFNCSECRTEFCCFTGFEMVSCNSGKYPELLQDKTLDVIGAQQVDDKKYEGKEETIYIGDDEEQEISDSETKEETISDLLDELFNMDEDFVSVETPEEKPLETIPTSKKVDSDLEIIEDSEDETSSNYSEDIVVIDEEQDVTASQMDFPRPQSQDMVLIEDSEDDLIQIQDDDDYEITEIVDDSDSPNDNVQKVIVDYDEYGEPIYSYITNVEKEDSISDSSEIQEIEETEFEEYVEEEAAELSLETEEIIEKNEDEELILEQKENIGLASPKIDIDNILDTDGSGVSDIVESAQNSIDNILNVTSKNEEIEDLAEEDTNEEVELLDDTTEDELVSDDEPIEEIEDSEEYTTDSNEEYIEYETDETSSEDELPDDILVAEDEETPVEDTNDEYEDVYDDSYEEGEEQEEAYDEYQDTDENEEVEYETEDSEENEEDEEDEEEQPRNSKFGLVLISILVLLGLAGGGVWFAMKNGKSQNEQNTIADSSADNAVEIPVSQQVNDMFEQPIEEGNIEIPNNNEEQPNNEEMKLPESPVETEQKVEKEIQPPTPESKVKKAEVPNAIPASNENDLIKPQENKTYGDINQAIASAFPSSNYVSFRGLNWFCTTELFSDKAFKNYLQNLDNTLKQNLKNNILNATEKPLKNTVAAKFAVDNNGNLKKVIISESSGSQSIDNIVLQSINESFVGEKSQILNDGVLKADMYYLKVVIKL